MINQPFESKQQELEAAPPDGPSLEEVEDLCEEHCFNVEGYESVECLQGLLNDAISRWGRPTPPAPAEGEVEELVAWLKETGQLLSRRPDIQCRVELRLFDRAAALLEQFSAAQAPQPVAVEGMPTDQELLRTYGLAKRDHCYEGPEDDWPRRAERAATVAGLRAILARWGRPATTPAGQEGGMSTTAPIRVGADARVEITRWENLGISLGGPGGGLAPWGQQPTPAGATPAHALPLPATTPAGQEGADAP